MPASPAPPPSSLGLEADTYIVLLGDEAGNPPLLTDECPWLIADHVSRSAGGSRVDTIRCRVDFGHKDASRIRNTTSPIGFDRQLEVRRLDADGNPSEIVCWGFIGSDVQEISHEEHEAVIARIDQFVFGGLLEQTGFWDPTLDEVIYLQIPCVFNPEIDDVWEPNRSYREDASRGNCSLFLDPESIRTANARDYQAGMTIGSGTGYGPNAWGLADAVHWLCWNLNPDETYIDNPTLDELKPIFVDVDILMFRNVHLQWGMTLPQALDAILTPFGYGWNLVFSLNADFDVRYTNFNFFKFGEGTTVSVFLQDIDEIIDPAQTNVAKFAMDYNISRVANQIIVYGGYKRVEDTFSLFPGWDPADDSLILNQSEMLEIGQPDALDHEDVGRKFVANEASDYTHLRPYIVLNGYPESIAAEMTVRRRRFWPCISQHDLGDDPTSNGYVLEWWDELQPDASSPSIVNDPGWVKVKSPYRVLHKECGILFTGKTIPEFAYIVASDPLTRKLFLRITCCVDSDTRLRHVADKTGESPQGINAPMLLDMHDRFKSRQRQSGSLYDALGTQKDSCDDTNNLKTFAELTRDNNDQAQVSLSITLLTSNHPEYEIGQLVDKVDGRNLTFDSHAGGKTPRLLQIIGINRSMSGEQRMELLLETFELERTDLNVRAAIHKNRKRW